ncbi:MAG: right-handed parallel beta-helix repeat-containing protein [Sedimentisphaerales bacterium]|nr:right-handed parallel beta-helix repeat-containing protein [Sedimentisphaerales bacterium]
MKTHAIIALILILSVDSLALTIQPAADQWDLVGADQVWRYLKGRSAPSEPADAWTQLGFDDSAWQTGWAGFGYGDDDDRTILDDMQGSYLTVYIRTLFECVAVPKGARLELVIDYDDGFVAYLNGVEVARRNLPSGQVTYQTAASSHEAGQVEVIDIGPAEVLLREGMNCLAIEGHNASLTSSDLSLNPVLRISSKWIKNGDIWVGDANTIDIVVQTQPDVAAVTICGIPAVAAAQMGLWKGTVGLDCGLNTIYAQAMDATGVVMQEGQIGVIYVPPERWLTGPIDANGVWTGAVALKGQVQILPGVTIRVEPATWILMGDQARLSVAGRLLATGRTEEPIHITRLADGTSWRQIFFACAMPSRLEHCIIEYGGTAGSHIDYYQPGPRSYHEAVVVAASHLDMYGCTVRRLPNDAPDAEADGIAIISDDPNLPGPASAHIKGCRFLGIGQGIHTRYSYVLVEDCYFQGKRGDNDDIDLYGESDPAPVIRHNFFDLPEHDDRINPTRCSAIIEGNIIMGSDDHGIVLRDRCWPVVYNNLILNCNSGGIAVENSCNALIANNTIVGCGRGIRLFDLGRWDPPYSLNPGGGTATIINCIIWDCPQAATLADSSNTSIKDRGSHLMVLFCNIKGGRQAISISGQYSTLTWGDGNLDVDPLFVDPLHTDYHLQPGSPLIDAGTSEDAPSTDLDGFARPCGKGFDIGAYEYGQCPSEIVP